MLQKLEVAISVDAVVTATRAYLERSLRELFAKGSAQAAQAQTEDGPDSLQGQLATLSSWHTWLLGHLRHFKVLASMLTVQSNVRLCSHADGQRRLPQPGSRPGELLL